MKKKYIIIILCVCVLAGVVVYTQIFMKKNEDEATTITYDNTKNNADFSDYTTTDVDLDSINGKYSITTGGVYHLTGTLSDGYIEVNTESNVEIILDNATITNSNGPCIYVISSKNTYIELVGESTLTDSSSYSGYSDDVNATIYSKDDLILFGDGTLNVNANYQDGIVGKDDLVIKSGTYHIVSKDDGIRGKDDVVIETGTFDITASGDGIKSTNEEDTAKGYILIESGTFTIVAHNDAIQAVTSLEIDSGTFTITTGGGATSYHYSSDTESNKGLKAGTSILINNITLNASTLDDGIHSGGVITIENGNINIKTGDDGIHADESITIDGGTIAINESYEGIEAHKITINNGDISVVSTDDGVNINGGTSNGSPNGSATVNTTYVLTINGGTLKVNAGGDGLDSNGSITMNGGTVYVDGPTDNGNGAIDYNNTFEMNGGTLIAAGSSGMVQNVSSDSKQSGVLIYFSSTQSAGTTVTIGDISYTPSKAFSSIVVSSPKLTTGTSYTVSLNGTTYKTFTLSSITTTVGTSSSNGMGNGGMMGGR